VHFQFNLRYILLLFIGSLFLASCATQTSDVEQSVEDSNLQLKIQDVLDIDLDEPITEEHIQDAIKLSKSQSFYLENGAKIILVQSGKQVPDYAMQEAMMKYYQVSVYSGLPLNKRRPKTSRKNDLNDAKNIISQKYIKFLRLIAANSKQDKIIVYWGDLESGYLDRNNQTVIWRSYTYGNNSTVKYLRYLIRFAVVDVKTGIWVMYSPINKQNEFIKYALKDSESYELQINKIKQETYDFAVRSLFIFLSKDNPSDLFKYYQDRAVAIFK